MHLLACFYFLFLRNTSRIDPSLSSGRGNKTPPPFRLKCLSLCYTLAAFSEVHLPVPIFMVGQLYA